MIKAANDASESERLLLRCGIAAPAAEDVPAGATFVQVPVTKVAAGASMRPRRASRVLHQAATTSTTYIPLLEMLGERQALKAYGSSFDYVSSPCLRSRIAPQASLRRRPR